MKNINSKQILNTIKNTFYAVDLDLDKLEKFIKGNDDKPIVATADLSFLIEKESLMNNYVNFMTRLHAYMDALENFEKDYLTDVRMNSFKSVLLHYVDYFRKEQEVELKEIQNVLDAGETVTLTYLEEAANIVAEKLRFVNNSVAIGNVPEDQVYEAVSDILKKKIQVKLIKERLHMNNSLYNYLHSYFEFE